MFVFMSVIQGENTNRSNAGESLKPRTQDKNGEGCCRFWGGNVHIYIIIYIIIIYIYHTYEVQISIPHNSSLPT